MNKRPRIVLDTNVFLVSLAERYRYHWIFTALVQEKYELCVTTDILLEYQEIIADRYGLTKTDSKLDFLLFLPNVIPITLHYNWNLLTADPDDNKFVDCAIAGNADFIVTNDKGFQVLDSVEYPTVSVLNYDEFEKQFKEQFLSE